MVRVGEGGGVVVVVVVDARVCLCVCVCEFYLSCIHHAHTPYTLVEGVLFIGRSDWFTESVDYRQWLKESHVFRYS
jgi:hypothetical protein